MKSRSALADLKIMSCGKYSFVRELSGLNLQTEKNSGVWRQETKTICNKLTTAAVTHILLHGTPPGALSTTFE